MRSCGRSERSGRRQAKYTWGTAIKDGPYDGKKPEDIAKDVIDKQKDAICNAKDGDKPRFPKECEKLKKLLAKDPRQPIVRCTLEKARGSTNPADGTIQLDGNDLLDSPYPGAVLIHELNHAIDVDDGKAAKTKAIIDKVAAGGKIDLALSAASVKERLDGELQAYFRVLDNAAFFDYPGRGLAHVKEQIKLMIAELAGIAASHPKTVNMTPSLKKDFADAFKKIKKWVNDHDDVKKNLATDKTDIPKDESKPEGEKKAWAEFLDDLIKLFE